MRIPIALVIGALAGAVTYWVGTNLSPNVDSPLLESITISAPFVLLVAGNLIMGMSDKRWTRYGKGSTVVPQSIGLLLYPGYLTFFGSDYEVFGGLATTVLCLPAVFVGSPLAMWLTRRMLSPRD